MERSMERQSGVKGLDPFQAPEADQKAHWRFKTIDFMEEYAPSWSSIFNDRTRLLWELIQADKARKNESNWAQCCFVYERRKVKGHLGHQKEALIPISRLLAQERIQTEAQLGNYLIKTLPMNEDSDQLLPQINMRHHHMKNKHLVLPEQEKELNQCQRNKEKTESRLIFLEAILEDLTKENHMLKEDMKVS